ncbi:MAG TPA: glycosyltransferase 87 family protein [Solirubrobacterales bacterium]|nr:glycosyltransferase 87 family protein [Solirubrobacterales bacterium]
MLALLAGAALACLIGLTKPPAETTHTVTGEQWIDLLRVLLTTCLAIVLVMGPGIALRALSGRPIRLAFLPLFGIGVMVLAGCLAWSLHGVLDTDLACLAVVGPVLGLMFGMLVAAGPEDFLTGEERRTLALLGIPVGLAIARSVWSLGPIGELDAGQIGHNLWTEARPDSHISFVVTEMVAHGTAPYGAEGRDLFDPYMFASRGPLAGIASAPVVLLSGGHPVLGVPNQHWEPFDAQGFMAYRIAMITMSATALLTMWELVRKFAGPRAARLALLLGISTPFVWAELIFTWPKLLAASCVLFAALWLFERKPARAGLMIGVGYLFHPGALLGYFALGLLALWPLRGAKLWRPQVRNALAMAAGTAVFVAAWLFVNRGHNDQNSFVNYLTAAAPDWHPSVGEWISFRLTSLLDTSVPLYLPIFQDHNTSINTLFGTSPGVSHFFFQYWTGVPFGFAILFFPILLVSLWRFAKRWTWPFFAIVVIPYVLFWIYWGSGSSGFLREGMQAWVLAVIAVIAIEQAASRFSWLRSRAIRAILALRGFEIFALAVGATLGTRGPDPISHGFGYNYEVSDAVAFAAIVLFSALMMFVIWRETAPGSMLRPAALRPGEAARRD